MEEKEAELSRHAESSRLTKILLQLRDRKLVGYRSAASQRRRRIITGRMFARNFTKLPLENLRRFSRQFFPVDVTILYFRRKLRFPAKRIAIADSYTKSSSMHRNSMTLIATTISFLSGNNEEDFFQLPTSSSSNVIVVLRLRIDDPRRIKLGRPSVPTSKTSRTSIPPRTIILPLSLFGLPRRRS